MELFTVLEAIFFLRLFVFSLPLFSSCESPTHKRVADSSPFPHGFLWGTASSAYQNSNSPENSFPNKNIADEVTILRLQYEGAYKAGGKGLNNWDGFTHQHPDKINDGSNGDIAVDQFHRYLDDIDLMNSLGVDSYRFSISWARILPNGKFGHVNYAGIRHYNKLIDALLSKGIQPFVTLTHMDYPQVLEDSYKSWLSPQIQSDFGYFAEVCFKHFGDRVKYWVTINEPNQQIVLSYLQGIFPPTRCSTPFGNCSSGNSEKEPFVAAHNMILAHAAAADIYRTKYQSRQKGKIGIVVQTMWFEPVSNSTADRLAAERAHSFYSNWILDPIVFGRYPAEMENILGPSLPRFSCNDATKLSNGLDFIGINHYTSYYVQDCIFSACAPGDGGSATEGFARKLSVYNGVPIGELTDIFWQHVDPDGFRKILNYMKRRYNNTPMFITENGFGEMQKSNSTREELIHDVKRVDYLKGYLDAMKTAMREGADVKGYFTWSLMDNFEWLYGYTLRFGLYFVDYADSLKRTPKLSASWYKNFIAEHKRCRNMCRHTL